MTNERYAVHLGVAVRTVAYWRERPEVIQRPAMQEVLDAALAQASPSVRAQFWLILNEQQGGRGGSGALAMHATAEDIVGLTEWVTATDTRDEAIELLDHTAESLAQLHTEVPASRLLGDVIQVHAKAQTLLRGGKQRLRQTRELLRIDGRTLAHASVLAGDLGRQPRAMAYGRAALTLLEEADADPGTALYALAKSARWQREYATAADLAARGSQRQPPDPMTIQLSCYEANSAALLGDYQRAHQALRRAEHVAKGLSSRQDGSPWSFPSQRLAIFRLSVLLQTGDPDAALAAADAADAAWAAGESYIPGTWAQIRIGAAIAWLAKDSLDGAAEEVQPVLSLDPELRISTVTGWLADLDRALRPLRFTNSPIGRELRGQIRQFRAAALPDAGGVT
jgi:hypothetical protein